MKKQLALGLLSVAVLAGIAEAQGTRKPVFAGAFYDADPARLAALVDGYLKSAAEPPVEAREARVLIAPHAGYIFSGQAAAHAYRVARGRPIETVVVVGTSHQFALDGGSVYLRGGYETPLGTVPVDEALAARIARASGFSYVAAAHEKEHSVEVQVPFIQRVLPDARIVPIVLGYPTRASINALAKGLGEALASPGALIVVSTDLSHYLDKEEANAVDARTIDLVRKADAGAIADRSARGENMMCGGGGVAAALLAVKKLGPPRVTVLRYTDSSAVTGDTARVVGYLAAAVSAGTPAARFSLSEDEKTELLELARRAVRTFVEDSRVVEYQTANPRLSRIDDGLKLLGPMRQLHYGHAESAEID